MPTRTVATYAPPTKALGKMAPTPFCSPCPDGCHQTCRLLACLRPAHEGRIHADKDRRHVCATHGVQPQDIEQTGRPSHITQTD